MIRPHASQRAPALTGLVASVLVVAAGAGLSACTAGAPAPTRTSVQAGVSGPDKAPSSASGVNASIQPEAWASTRLTAVDRLVRARAAAADASDERAWLAPLIGADLRARQGTVLRRMQAMRVDELTVAAVSERVAPVPTESGSSVTWEATASLTYVLRGFDSGPRSFVVDLTLTADPARPDGAVIIDWQPSERPEPWDLDGLSLRRTGTALVLAVGAGGRVDEIASRAAAAARRVSAVWGRAEPSVWVAPATDADAARLLGRPVGDLAGVAAATDGPLEAGRPAGADRIVLVPGAVASLTGAGRDVVMTHELTHATVRASTTRDVPLWLSEGFAEFVAYRGVDLTERAAVSDALDYVRARGLPTALPSGMQLEPSSGTLSAAYGLSLLVVRTIAQRHGTADLVRFYRAAAGGIAVPTSEVGNADAIVDRALRVTLSDDMTAIVAAWRDRIDRLLG